MKNNKFVIPRELMDLNTFINSQRQNRYAGATAKKKETKFCAFHVRQAMKRGLAIERYPIIVKFRWVMSNKRKDKDNISFAKKFVLDGMQAAGLIENDGWQQIENFEDSFDVDKENPRVEVEITYEN